MQLYLGMQMDGCRINKFRQLHYFVILKILKKFEI